MAALQRNPDSEDEYEKDGEELEEAKGLKDEREEIFLRAVVQASKVHKVEVSKFSGTIGSDPLVRRVGGLL